MTSINSFTAVLWLGSFCAGVLGSLTGLGGGVVIVPLLTLALDVDIRYAVGASLVSVIATSSGAAAAFVSEGFTNVRIAMLLEIATTFGALLGAALAVYLNAGLIAVVFGVILVYPAYAAVHRHPPVRPGDRPDPLAGRLRLDGSFPDGGSRRRYFIRHVPAGFALMGVAGGLSGLLGIGSGALKVLAMDRVMKIPYKVSSATSNFMIGVTAAASLVLAGGMLYLVRYGHQQPSYAVFHEEAADLRSISGIVGRAWGGSARGLIQLGLVVLILTPMARVVTSLVLFIREKDRLYAVITAVVLAALMLGLFGSC